MSVRALSTRDRRALAIGAGVVAFVLLVTRGWPAYERWLSERRASAIELRGEVQRVRQGALALREMRLALSERAARKARLDSRLLAGESDATASASLVDVVRRIADSAGVVTSSTQVRADSAMTGRSYRLVRLRLVGEGDVRGVATLLGGLENGSALLVVRSLTISQATPAASDSIPERLAVELLVNGIARAASREGASGGAR